MYFLIMRYIINNGNGYYTNKKTTATATRVISGNSLDELDNNASRDNIFCRELNKNPSKIKELHLTKSYRKKLNTHDINELKDRVLFNTKKKLIEKEERELSRKLKELDRRKEKLLKERRSSNI